MAGRVADSATLGGVTTLPAAVLEHPIVGRNLTASTFGAELGDAATLIVLLRHPG
jgi:hypothetical protein